MMALKVWTPFVIALGFALGLTALSDAQGPVVLRNSSGTEIATSAAPVRVDPTGSTTQPVSGTVTATQGGTWTVQPGNTANTTAWKVDGSAVTQPVSGTVSITANSSVNVAQLAGTTTSVNSGTKDAGTLRVVIATDQPQLTNKLLVTPDANSAVNVAQFGGTNVVTGTGAGGAGIPRVTISNDSSLAANQSVNLAQVNGVTTSTGVGVAGTGTARVVDVASGSTGSAPPTQASYVGGVSSGATGGLLAGVTVCDSKQTISLTANTQIITGTSGRHVYICSINLVVAAATNVAIVSGTGSTCATGIAGMAGGTTAATGWNFAANGGLSQGSGIGWIMRTGATGDNVCVLVSAANQTSGVVTYAVY